MIQVSRFVCQAFAIAAVGLAMVAPARADHHDDARDNPQVVAAKLNHMGFMEWRRLRWHHGFWDIDDARRDNGYVYDLRLEAGTLDLVKLERERRRD